MNHKKQLVLKLALTILLIPNPVSGIGGIFANPPQSQNRSRIRVVVGVNSTPLEAYSFTGGILVSSSGAITAEDLSITKGIDNTTPLLSLMVANGVHAPSVTLSLYTVDANNVETLFLTILMTNVAITAVNPTTDSTKALTSPIETVNFNYSMITYTYHIPGVPGTLEFCYDRSVGHLC